MLSVFVVKGGVDACLPCQLPLTRLGKQVLFDLLLLLLLLGVLVSLLLGDQTSFELPVLDWWLGALSLECRLLGHRSGRDWNSTAPTFAGEALIQIYFVLVVFVVASWPFVLTMAATYRWCMAAGGSLQMLLFIARLILRQVCTPGSLNDFVLLY